MKLGWKDKVRFTFPVRKELIKGIGFKINFRESNNFIYYFYYFSGVLFSENPVRLQYPFDFYDFDQIDDYWVRYEGQFNSDSRQGILFSLRSRNFIFDKQ